MVLDVSTTGSQSNTVLPQQRFQWRGQLVPCPVMMSLLQLEGSVVEYPMLLVSIAQSVLMLVS